MKHAAARLRRIAVTLTAIAALAACATKTQVQEIVTASNRSMIQASLLDLEHDPLTHADRNPNGGWEQTTQRIEAFVAAHPDMPETTAPLQLRAALILTVHGQESLATAAFGRIPNRDALNTERDRTLYDLREHLPWWFRWSGEPAMSLDSQTKARDALTAFATACDALDMESGLRSYLEEMRVWIALKLANDTRDKTARNDIAVSAIERYSRIFNEKDQSWVKDGSRPATAAESGSPEQMRRRLRSIEIFTSYARWDARLSNEHPAWNPGWVKTAIDKAK